MRFMVIVPTTPATENTLPSADMLTRMGEFNRELGKAGVMLAGEGLRASSFGTKITFTGPQQVFVTDGPFSEAKELVGGFWIIDVPSKDDAIRWMRKAPFGPGVTLEIRALAEVEDFGDELRGDLASEEQAMRERSGYARKPR